MTVINRGHGARGSKPWPARSLQIRACRLSALAEALPAVIQTGGHMGPSDLNVIPH